MAIPKWLVIAKNQYRITTSSIRVIRPYFPYLIIGLLVVYVTVIAPMIVNLIIDDFLAFIITQVAVPIVQILLFMFFFYLILFPISDTLRETHTSQIEIFLAGPVKPSDVLIGEFLGKIPFYAIAIVVITGTFTALLNPLGMDIAQNTIIISIFTITFLSALWIGTVIAALLRTKLGKTTRGKDVGRALGVLIALPMIAIIYSMIGGGLFQVLVDPNISGVIRVILDVIPSSWAGRLFVIFASNPSNLGAIMFETLASVAGLLIFFVAILWLGTKVADRAYSLESTSFGAIKAKPDGFFYRVTRYLGGGASGALLVALFKDYGRRLENLSWIVYTMGLVAMISIFLSDPYSDPGDPLFLLSLMAIPLLSGSIVGTLSRGKETLFLYKKAPKGIERFVKTRLLQGWLMAIPIATFLMTISTSFVPHVTIIPLLINIALGIFRTVAMVALFLGLTLRIPVFAEKSRERIFGIMINIQIVIFATIGMEIGFSRLGFNARMWFPSIEPFTGLVMDYLVQTVIFAFTGITLLYLGIRKLSRVE